LAEKRIKFGGTSIVVYDDLEYAKAEAIQRVMGSIAGNVYIFKTADGWYGYALASSADRLPAGFEVLFSGAVEPTPGQGYTFDGWKTLYPHLAPPELLRRHSLLIESVCQILDSDNVMSAVEEYMDNMAYLLTENVVVYGVIAKDSDLGQRDRDSQIEQVIVYATHADFDCRLLTIDEPSHYTVDWTADPWGMNLCVLVADMPNIANIVLTGETFVIALYAKEKLP